MARENNAITIGSGFNVSASAPIDSRSRVEYVTDLVKGDTWKRGMTPVYSGMVVCVIKNEDDTPLGELWILPQASSWYKYGRGYGIMGDGTDEYEGGWIKLQDYWCISGDDVEYVS